MTNIDKTAAEITAAYSETASEAFPYEDCYRLLKEYPEEELSGLIPDLDLYFYDVASHAIGIRQVLRLTPDGVAESRRKLSRSFFEMHPRYERLRPHITSEATPMLHRRIETIERVRHLLLDLLEKIEAREAADVKT